MMLLFLLPKNHKTSDGAPPTTGPIVSPISPPSLAWFWCAKGSGKGSGRWQWRWNPAKLEAGAHWVWSNVSRHQMNYQSCCQDCPWAWQILSILVDAQLDQFWLTEKLGKKLLDSRSPRILYLQPISGIVFFFQNAVDFFLTKQYMNQAPMKIFRWIFGNLGW